MDRQHLIRLLLGELVSGRLEGEAVIPAVRRLARDQDVSSESTTALEILDALDDLATPEDSAPGGAMWELRRDLEERARQAALSVRDGAGHESVLRSARWWLGDLTDESPAGWSFNEPIRRMNETLDLLADRYLLASRALDGGVRPPDPLVGPIRDALALRAGALAEVFDAWKLPLAKDDAEGPTAGNDAVRELIRRRRVHLERRRAGTEQRLRDELPKVLPTDVDENEALGAAAERLVTADPDVRRSFLDLLARWPSPRCVAALDAVDLTASERRRLSLSFTLRFGSHVGGDWDSCRAFLHGSLMDHERRRAELAERLSSRPGEALLLWHYARDGEASLSPDLVRWWRGHRTVDVDRFVDRWSSVVDAESLRWLDPVTQEVATEASEWVRPPGLADALRTAVHETSEPRPTPATATTTPVAFADEDSDAGTDPVSDQVADAVSEEATPHPVSPLWDEHIRPFFSEYWYLVAGVVLTVVGASTVAFYTWDEWWLIRHTVTPGLLALFTWALGAAARWVEGKDERLTGAATILRAAAIALLPLNFMTILRAASDPSVRPAWLVASVLGAVYLLGGGRLLRGWCRDVHPSLGAALGRPVLAANGLLVLVALVVSVRGAAGLAPQMETRLLLAAGVYGVAAYAAWCLNRFLRADLTRELAARRTVPWFLGTLTTLTLVQVFLWLYGSAGFAPHVSTYGPLTILAGWQILRLESRSLELRNASSRHEAESFLGFAAILLGVLMCFSEPHVRVLGFVLAGGLWLWQNRRLKWQRHDVIGLVLLGLGGASISLLPGVPEVALPAPGLLVALGFHLLARRVPRLGAATSALIPPVLLITAVVAPLAQWHFRSQPAWTAAYLLPIAALFFRRGLHRKQVHWLHVAMAIVALALPYLGFVDLVGRRLNQDTLAFALGVVALLWLAAVRLAGSPPLLAAARSTVVLLYALFGIAAIVIRLAGTYYQWSEQRIESPVRDPNLLREAMHLSAPWLIVMALAIITFTSRSLLPAVLAGALGTFLAPEIFHVSARSLPWDPMLFHTALALGMLVFCFPLRRWPALRRLADDPDGGDLYLGTDPLPWRRNDASLFVLPISTIAAYLLLKAQVWLGAERLRTVLTNPGPSDLGLSDPVLARALCLGAAAWLALSLLYRRRVFSFLPIQGFWISLLLGLGLWLDAQGVADPWMLAVLGTGIACETVGILLARIAGEPDSHVTVALRGLMFAGSLLLAFSITGALVFAGGLWSPALAALGAFLLAETAYHGLRKNLPVFGVAFYLLLGTQFLAWRTPGDAALATSTDVDSLRVLLWYLLATQWTVAAMEWRPQIFVRLRALAGPALVLSALTTAALAGFGLIDLLTGATLPADVHWLLLATVLLTARALGVAPFVLAAAMLGYGLLHHGQLVGLRLLEVLDLLTTPWRWGLWAVGVASLSLLATELQRRQISIAGAFAPERRLGLHGWFTWPAAVSAVAVALLQLAMPDTRDQVAELAATYLGAAALGLVVASRLRRDLRAHVAGWLTVSLVALGNLHVVDFFLGEALLAAGLSQIHLICLGLSTTLALLEAFRITARREAVIAFSLRAGLALAAGILVLLSADYLLRPDLSDVSHSRFLISGAMALLAGLFFRRAARRVDGPDAEHAALSEACYHFGVTVAFWCVALLVPWLRHPTWALLALALPGVYFWLRAELGARSQSGLSYRRSATVLSFLLLALYASRAAFQLLLFPGTAVDVLHYHHNSFLVVVLGLLMLRLRGLGGTDWLAYYGGLSMAVGSYFSLTFLPGLSPFDNLVAGAWCVVILGHFWTLAATRTSPLRTAVRGLAALGVDDWARLRRSWGLTVLVATQLVVVGVCLRILAGHGTSTELPSQDFAPLLLGAASLLVHHGLFWRRGLGSVLHGLAALQVLVALHADFLLPSYLPERDVAWTLLGLWLALLIVDAVVDLGNAEEGIARVVGLFAALVAAHVLWVHQPASIQGLALVTLGTALVLGTPRPATRRVADVEGAVLAAVCLVPSWLVFFARLGPGGSPDPRNADPFLGLAATLLLTGVFAQYYRRSGPERRASSARRPRLVQQLLTWLKAHGEKVLTVSLLASLLVLLAVQVRRYGLAWSWPQLFVFAAVHLGAASAWLWLARLRGTDPANREFARASESAFGQLQELLTTPLFQAHLVLLFVSLRDQMWQIGWWSHEYDVWVSLALSFGLAGAKDLIDQRPRAVRYPLLLSLFALPILALVWVLVHGLGTDVALVVIGLHAVLFTYMGRHSRNSPLHVVAVAGFVAFVVLTFWSRLEVRVLQAYTLPVGVGVLVLLHLFREQVNDALRRGIRLVTLVVMLASAGFYVVAGDDFLVGHHLTLLAVCLAAMAVGSLLRVRIYLILGFGGLLLEAAAIAQRTVGSLERTARMTTLGAVVLALGVLLVVGAVVYKTREQEIADRLKRWRSRFESWE